MIYNVYDSSVSTYYQHFMYTNDDWVVFDINDTETIMLIGSYVCEGNKIVGTTKQVITISTNNSYNSTPNISITDVESREDTINFSTSTSYRIISNIENAPTQKNSTYETSYKTYNTCYTILILLVIAFLFTWIKGVLPWNKSN